MDGSHSLLSLPRGGVRKAKLAKSGCRPISLRPCLYYANNEALQQLLNLFAARAGQTFFFSLNVFSPKIWCYVETSIFLGEVLFSVMFLM